MVQGTCIDIETLKIQGSENIFQNIRPTNRLYTVRYKQSLQEVQRHLQYEESVPGSLQFALVDPKDEKIKSLIVQPGSEAKAMNLSQHRKLITSYDSEKKKT